MAATIQPVILSGGSGTRLWPLSRESFPKQFLKLTGETTLLQQTALRVADQTRFKPAIVVGNEEHRFIIAEQLREAGTMKPSIVLEPAARNTAPAVASAAILALGDGDGADVRLLVIPADHAIPDSGAFLATIEAANALDQAFVLFGVEPDHAATGYGYIRVGAPLGEGVNSVTAFKEKPSRELAQTYVDSHDHLWNSGIFLLSARAILKELERYEPGLVAAVRQAVDAAKSDMDFLRLDPTGFLQAPSISIDRAVMERTDGCVVVRAGFPWSDIGSWSDLRPHAGPTVTDNVQIGDTITQDTHGSYLRSEGPLIAALGVNNLVIVATSDAVLVSDRGADQDVGKIVERLRTLDHPAAAQTPRVYRPWGWYEALHAGDRFQVKRITVNPGQKLSLQKHFHRAEHWVVVNGVAEVHLDGVQSLLSENESIYIPIGSTHRLGNPGKVPLNVIEVQSGAYLGEDDIVRLEDVYARVRDDTDRAG